MSSDVVANPQTTAGESKSARKKKAKAETAAATATPAVEKSSSELGTASSDPAGKANGAEGTSEHPYIRELQKNLRNVNKKLNSTAKVDAIVQANAGVSLDDLVASRKINADQKASILKKPQLQSQITQIEEQIAQYKKFDQDYQHQFGQERESLRIAHLQELEKLRETLKAEAALESEKAFREKFLTLSRFLRAAAARRQREDDDDDLTKAFEGALLLVYGGDTTAVGAVEKLIAGSSDSVPSTEGISLGITYGHIKQAALEEAPFAAEEAWVDDVAQSQPAPPDSETPTAISTDPTITHAGLTEITTGMSALHSAEADTPSIPPVSNVDAGAANAAAEEQWDKQPSSSDDPLAESFEMVPRDPAETESPAAVAAIGSTQSWADDTPDPAPATTPTPANGHDGFSEVHHYRGGRGRAGGENRGGYRGRGGPRDSQGRGRGRGRGRGEYRGGGGPRGGGFRGGRGSSESQ